MVHVRSFRFGGFAAALVLAACSTQKQPAARMISDIEAAVNSAQDLLPGQNPDVTADGHVRDGKRRRQLGNGAEALLTDQLHQLRSPVSPRGRGPDCFFRVTRTDSLGAIIRRRFGH